MDTATAETIGRAAVARFEARKRAESTGKHCGYCRADIVPLTVWLRSPRETVETWRAYLRGFAIGERAALRSDRSRARSPRQLVSATR